MYSGIIAEIKLRAEKQTIHELRQIAREVGVSRPAYGRKERLVEDIIKIARCEIEPAPRSARGAPPKSAVYDKQLVADIMECRALYSEALKGGRTQNPQSVSDGVGQSECSGILSRKDGGYVLQSGCSRPADGVSVHESFINRFGLKEGDFISGVKAGGAGEAALVSLSRINGSRPEELNRTPFESLAAEYPSKRIKIYAGPADLAARMTDFFAPVGMGQRGLITGGCNDAGLTLVKQIAAAICLNERSLKVVIHLISARPEDINSFGREQCGAELFYTSFSDKNEDVVNGAELVLNYCKRQVECGKNVVLLADGLARLERAAARTGECGAAKRFLSAAVCSGGTSLTVIGAISAEDASLESELSGIANMRAHLSLGYALSGVEPPLDALKTFTDNAAALQNRNEFSAAAALRKRLLGGSDGPESIAAMFKKTENNGQIVRELTDG